MCLDNKYIGICVCNILYTYRYARRIHCERGVVGDG